MGLLGVGICALLLSAVVALPASAAGGFGEPSVVGAGPVVVGAGWASPVAAVDARGGGALAWTDGTRVHVARKARGGAWTEQVISRQADLLPDLQLVVTRGGDTIAAWTETYADGNVNGGVPDWFLAAVAPQGRPFGRPQVISKGPRADSALPRMAALADGRVVLIWRAARWPAGGELRMAFRRPGHRFDRSHGLGFDGVAPAVVATADGGAVVTWASTGALRAPHRLLAARLPAGGHRLGRSFPFFPSAVAGARLAAGPGNVVIATWASRRPPVGLLAARLAPGRGPVRILRRGPPNALAAPVSLGPGGSALATFLAPSGLRANFVGPGSAPSDGQWAASGTATGGFDAPVELLTPTSGYEVGPASPAILPTGDAIVVWAQGRPPAPGQHTLDVLVADGPAGSTAFAALDTLSSGHYGYGHRPDVTLAQAAGRVLAAWPGPGPRGGMIATERP